jgi:Pathogenicity locus
MKRSSRRRTVGKAGTAQDVAALEDIPNVGPAVAADLRRLGITAPADLLGRGPYALYEDLCERTGQRHDPCLLDTFIAAARLMVGGPKKPWWKYTAERKRRLAARRPPADSD